MKKIVSKFSKILLISLCCAQMTKVQAQTSAPRMISENARGYAQQVITELTHQEPLQSSLCGAMAINLKGDTLLNHQSSIKLIPASTMKLISTGLALQLLGPEYQFKTQIAYDGEIQDGVLKGNLYLIGGGDPTIASKDSIAPPVETLFKRWLGFLQKAGIHQIDGQIIGDGRYLNGDLENTNWSYDDLGTYYGAGGNGLCFYRNIQDIHVAPGAQEGAPIQMNISYPQTPWITYASNCQTGPVNTGDQLYLFCTDLQFYAEMRGTLAAEHYTKKLECSNKFGALTCAYYFSNFLKVNGIAHKGFCQADGYGRVSDSFTGCADGKTVLNLSASTPAKIQKIQLKSVDQLHVLGSTLSPKLERIARLTNYRSDNFYAETLMRTLGKKFRGSADYDTCRKFYKDAFGILGLDTSHGVVINDGSGLSRKNYIAPEFFCRFLKRMTETEVAENFISTLGQPGSEHYPNRMVNEPDSVRHRIYWKSGSMNGVRCFSGYILPQSGHKEETIIFSVMTNNCTASDWIVYPLIDRIIAAVAYEN